VAALVGAAGPVAIDEAVERAQKRSAKILLNALESGDIQTLSEKQLGTFLPMTYSFFENA
jgi:hypothetical protein